MHPRPGPLIGARPRIALVSVRFGLFDAQMPPDFPARMRAHAARSAEVLGSAFDVVAPDLIEDEEGARRVREELAVARLDAVVFAPAMAAPPSYAAIALERTTAPLVIWNAPSVARLPDGLTQAQATEHTTTVGALMYGNVRVREGRRPLVVTAAHDDPAAIDRMLRTVRAATAAGSLRGGVVLRVGDAIPGYLDVDATPGDLAALGLREVAVGLEAWEAAVEAASPAAATMLLDDVTHRWRGDPGPQAERSARVAVALDRAMADADAVAGTVNCHGSWFRGSERVGITACLAVAWQAEQGRSISCTGDQPTAIALHLARLMAGSALYCEGYTPEAETGLLLLAAGGEGDPAWADPPGAVILEANDHYPGARGNGTGLAFRLRRGPATLLSLSPTPAGWVLAWATGEVVETRYDAMRGPNGMFRFDSGPAVEAVDDWIASGATHHNALAPGRLDVEVPALAASLGLRVVRV
jgi:L-arabinose isomerase